VPFVTSIENIRTITPSGVQYENANAKPRAFTAVLEKLLRAQR
jgi:hypothetical protein